MISFVRIIFLVFILYAFCFQPILNKFIYVGIEFSIVLFFFMYKSTREVFNTFHKEIALLFLITLYSLILDLFSGEAVYVDRFAACLLQGFFVTYVLSYFIQKNTFCKENFERALIVMAFVASLISITSVS